MLEASHASTRDYESLSFAPRVSGYASNLGVSFHRVDFLVSPLNFASPLTLLPPPTLPHPSQVIYLTTFTQLVILRKIQLLRIPFPRSKHLFHSLRSLINSHRAQRSPSTQKRTVLLRVRAPLTCASLLIHLTDHVQHPSVV